MSGGSSFLDSIVPRPAAAPRFLTDLSGKVALVTGGSRGIGRATAIRLAQGGAKIALNYHSNHDAAQDGLGELKGGGAHAMAVAGDVGTPEAVEKLKHRIRQAGGLIWFEPRLRVTYRPRGSVRALAVQYFNYGRWRRVVSREHPGTVNPRYLAPPAAVGDGLNRKKQFKDALNPLAEEKVEDEVVEGEIVAAPVDPVPPEAAAPPDAPLEPEPAREEEPAAATSDRT